jgi:CBS domain-containing protein
MRAVAIADVMNVRVVSVSPDASAREAVDRMVAENVGSVAICDGSRLVGIFTERDVLRLAAEGVDLAAVAVHDVMTSGVTTISPDADIVATARLMGERRIRHLPVVEGENVLGIVGIRDVLAALAELSWRAHDAEAHETVHGLLARR